MTTKPEVEIIYAGGTIHSLVDGKGVRGSAHKLNLLEAFQNFWPSSSKN